MKVTKGEKEKAIEVLKWVLCNVNGYSEEDLAEIDYDHCPELDCLIAIMYRGCKYNDCEARI